MNGYGTGIEFVILPETTYIPDRRPATIRLRRIFTDGRDFRPTPRPPSWATRSANGSIPTPDGRYDTLEIETRNFKGPRVYDTPG